MRDARLVFFEGDAGRSHAVLAQCSARGVDLGPSRPLFFFGPGVATDVEAPEVHTQAFAVVVWGSDALPGDRLRRWLEATDGRPGNVIVGLHHGPVHQPPPDFLEHQLKAAAAGRPVLWVAYSHDRHADSRFDSFARVLEALDQKEACRSLIADLVRRLIGPQLLRGVGEVLTSLLVWDIELQQQIETRDVAHADDTCGECLATLDDIGEALAAFTAQPDYFANPVGAIQWLVQALGFEVSIPKDRVHVARFSTDAEGQYVAVRTSMDRFEKETLAAMSAEALVERFEEYHAQLEDLRDLLLHMVREVPAE